MRRLLSVSLVLVFSLQFAGVYCYYFFRLIETRMEMHAKVMSMPKNELTEFILTPEQYFDSQVEEGEVRIDGKLYDVAFVETRDNHVRLYGLHDQSEDNLVAFIQTIVKHHHHDKKRTPAKVLNLLVLKYLPGTFILELKQSLDHKNNTIYLREYFPYKPALFTPPPRT